MSKKKRKPVFPELEKGGRLIDTHCHLDMDQYRGDIDEVIDRAKSRGIDRIITFDKKSHNKGLRGRFLFMTSLMKEKFDLVISLKNTWMHKFLGIPTSWSVKKPSGRKCIQENKHIADVYLDFLKSHGINADAVTFGFDVESEKAFAENFLKRNNVTPQDKVIGILPAAAWLLKSWSLRQWNELAEILQRDYGVKTINLGRFSNNAFGKKLSKEISKVILSAEDSTLKQVMSLLKRCDLFIGPDSSLLHIASCLGTEVIGLYGPTSPDYLYPYFHKGSVMLTKEKRDCMPCYPSLSFCPCKDKRHYGLCMDDISVSRVLNEVKAKLKP